MPNLMFLIGIPGSGKTTYADEKKKEGWVVHSSDKIREELFGNESIQANPDIVFKTLHDRVKASLSEGLDTIYDATSVNWKRRRAFVDEIKRIPCNKIAILFATPYEKCLENNSKRKRNVPVDVIKRMYENFYIPHYFEGWDEIKIVWNFDSNSDKYDAIYRLSELDDFDQENSNHSLTLGGHLDKCRDYLFKVYPDNKMLGVAGQFHDIGKPFVKSFLNKKGETTPEAHYYNHNNVSAYEVLFYLKCAVNPYPNRMILDVAALICWHMMPYFFETEKTANKYKKIWGESFFDDVMKLHEGDVYAH